MDTTPEETPTPKQELDTGTTTEQQQATGKRQWKPSEKGLEYFKEKKNLKSNKMRKIWAETEMLLDCKWNEFKSLSLLL